MLRFLFRSKKMTAEVATIRELAAINDRLVWLRRDIERLSSELDLQMRAEAIARYQQKIEDAAKAAPPQPKKSRRSRKI